MASKEQLISQGIWDIYNDKPYENRTIQATQLSAELGSVPAMATVEEVQRSQRQTEARLAPQRSGQATRTTPSALQVIKEGFCVVEDLVKYLGSHGHHLAPEYSKALEYLNQTRPLIS